MSTAPNEHDYVSDDDSDATGNFLHEAIVFLNNVPQEQTENTSNKDLRDFIEPDIHTYTPSELQKYASDKQHNLPNKYKREGSRKHSFSPSALHKNGSSIHSHSDITGKLERDSRQLSSSPSEQPQEEHKDMSNIEIRNLIGSININMYTPRDIHKHDSRKYNYIPNDLPQDGLRKHSFRPSEMQKHGSRKHSDMSNELQHGSRKPSDMSNELQHGSRKHSNMSSELQHGSRKHSDMSSELQHGSRKHSDMSSGLKHGSRKQSDMSSGLQHDSRKHSDMSSKLQHGSRKHSYIPNEIPQLRSSKHSQHSHLECKKHVARCIEKTTFSKQQRRRQELSLTAVSQQHDELRHCLESERSKDVDRRSRDLVSTDGFIYKTRFGCTNRNDEGDGDGNGADNDDGNDDDDDDDVDDDAYSGITGW